MPQDRPTSRRQRRRADREAPAASEEPEASEEASVELDWLDLLSPEASVVLEQGEIVGYQQLTVGSNYNFVVVLRDDSTRNYLAVYKPRRGEVPLWDFPEGTLYKREYAAYLFAEALRWRFVPPTTVREGPFGVGSMQLFVKPGAARDLYEFAAECRDELCRITLFDHITNNADRKPTHILRSDDGHVWGIDHGLTFNTDWKLRTVIWEFVEQPIPAALLDDVRALVEDAVRVSELRARMTELISVAEFRATLKRARRLCASGVFPALDPGYNVPRGFW